MERFGGYVKVEDNKPEGAVFVLGFRSAESVKTKNDTERLKLIRKAT